MQFLMVSIENFDFNTVKILKKVLQTIKKCAIIYKHEINRGVAQLVARVVWDHEVAGSIPVTSTMHKIRYFKRLR